MTAKGPREAFFPPPWQVLQRLLKAVQTEEAEAAAEESYVAPPAHEVLAEVAAEAAAAHDPGSDKTLCFQGPDPVGCGP